MLFLHGCSIGITPNYYDGNTVSNNHTLSLGKFPICNFLNDAYKNWLAQNSLNVLGATITTDDMNVLNNIINGVVSTSIAIGSGNIAGAGLTVVGSVEGVISSLIQKNAHEMIPSTVRGQLNLGDLNNASGNNTFHFYKMTIKQEYAKIIDEFFSMYGYKINLVKIPSLFGRSNWNYLKTKNVNLVGNIPQKDLEELKEMFNRGVTIWHSANTFLDYSQNNTIIS